ncbi:MAG: dephospho-CoA kinase [Acidiferrobacteraceae bacterium]
MASKVLRVGLTGGVGAGKSHVASLFSVLGVPIIDADEIARALTAPGASALSEIVDAFGQEMLDSTGVLRRDVLRRRVFGHPEERRILEGILHPPVRATMEARTQTLDAAYCVMVIPLLIESGMRDFVDHVLVVDASPEVQIERVLRRSGLSRMEAERIMAAQADRQMRLKAADDVIENNMDGVDLSPQVHALHKKYLELAEAHHR